MKTFGLRDVNLVWDDPIRDSKISHRCCFYTSFLSPQSEFSHLWSYLTVVGSSRSFNPQEHKNRIEEKIEFLRFLYSDPKQSSVFEGCWPDKTLQLSVVNSQCWKIATGVFTSVILDWDLAKGVCKNPPTLPFFSFSFLSLMYWWYWWQVVSSEYLHVRLSFRFGPE